MFNSLKLVIWDFDGVIILSDNVRVEGFKQIFSSYPKNQVEELLQFHKANGGLSRYVKIRYFFERIRREGISEKEVNEYAEDFAILMKEELCKPEFLNPDWIDAMAGASRQYEHHIASGSDGNELRYLCHKLGIAHYFKSINGSPISKIELTRQIIEQSERNLSEIGLIGDSINDFEAAKANGIRFFGYNNDDLCEVSEKYLQSLTDELSCPQ